MVVRKIGVDMNRFLQLPYFLNKDELYLDVVVYMKTSVSFESFESIIIN